MEGTYKKEEKKEKKILKEEKIECLECGTKNELEAKFCEECGYNFQVVRCPKCKTSALKNADICESCGEWLLEGQCKFCYTPLEEGAKFCAECGNPVNGVECPKCHSISYFDFCKVCDIPLTEQAIQYIENLENSEELRELIGGLEDERKTTNTVEQIELESIKKYQQKFKQPEANRKTFTLFSKEETETLDARIHQQEEKKSQQKKRETPNAWKKIQQKEFTNNQEARRFFGALKVLLPVKIKTKIKKERPVGWLCNAYDCLHPEGPQGCSAPSSGGTWIFEEFEEIEEKTEIEEVKI